MSQPNSPTPIQPTSPYGTPAQGPPANRKQMLNVYTMMLVIAFIALCIGCGALWLELSRFGQYPWWKTSSVDRPAATAVAQLETSSRAMLA